MSGLQLNITGKLLKCESINSEEDPTYILHCRMCTYNTVIDVLSTLAIFYNIKRSYLL